jgi:hypothetical protein
MTISHFQPLGEIIMEPGTKKNHSQPTMMEASTFRREKEMNSGLGY